MDMVPTLVRFYGGTRQDWSSATWGEGLQFWRAVPRIRAQESGAAIPDLAGFDFKELIDKVTKDAAAQAPKPAAAAPARPASAAEGKKTMAAMGIRVEA